MQNIFKHSECRKPLVLRVSYIVPHISYQIPTVGALGKRYLLGKFACPDYCSRLNTLAVVRPRERHKLPTKNLSN